MTLRQKIEERINLSCTSQLFLLKHKEVKGAEEDMAYLADQICSLVKERLEKIYWVKSETKVLEDIDTLITELSEESE